jgi:hypothetical protein
MISANVRNRIRRSRSTAASPTGVRGHVRGAEKYRRGEDQRDALEGMIGTRRRLARGRLLFVGQWQ